MVQFFQCLKVRKLHLRAYEWCVHIRCEKVPVYSEKIKGDLCDKSAKTMGTPKMRLTYTFVINSVLGKPKSYSNPSSSSKALQRLQMMTAFFSCSDRVGTIFDSV